MKNTYSIYEAKAKLSEIIRVVKNRRRVVITERGIPVVEVVPYRPETQTSLKKRLKDLESRGALVTARKNPGALRHLRQLPGAVRRFLELDRD